MRLKVKLGTRFALLLLLVFALGIALSGVTLYVELRAIVEQSVSTNGLLLLHAMNAVRSYTNDQITPLLKSNNAAQAADTFVPESVPAFSARSVFGRLHTQPDYSKFLYKEAADNPTAIQDLSDPFETELLQKLRGDRNLTEISGFRILDGKPVFYTARPMAVTAPACLSCHTTAATAPKGQVDTYGPSTGFGWQLNDIVAAQMVYVPAAEIWDRSQRAWLTIMLLSATSLGIAVLATNLLLRRSVLRPIAQMATLAGEISADEVNEQSPQKLAQAASRPDELGQMARIFQRMAEEVYAREQALKRQLEAMRIEIDEAKKARQVADVVESSSFEDLRSRAQQIREQRKRHEGAGNSPNPKPDPEV